VFPTFEKYDVLEGSLTKWLALFGIQKASQKSTSGLKEQLYISFYHQFRSIPSPLASLFLRTRHFFFIILREERKNVISKNAF